MENYPMTFSPKTAGLDPSIWIAWLVVAVGVAVLIYFFSKKGKERLSSRTRQLGSSLVFVATMVAFGTGFFGTWAHFKIGQVKIEADGITTSYGKALRQDIGRVYLEEELERSPFNQNLVRDTSSFLIIEEKRGKTHVLSEDHYDIEAIYKALEVYLKKRN